MTGILYVTFEGERLEARRGESLAATLTAHGVRGFRTTRTGQDRGMFCGMGVCQDCLVEVDGRPNQQSCMIKVEGAMKVRREAHLRPLPPVRESRVAGSAAEMRVERPDVLVVGAGPAGLSAAIAARRLGAEVVVLDERSAPGGQFFKQLAVAGVAPPPDRQHADGARLIERARALGVEIRPDTLVWGAFEPREFAVSGPSGTSRYEPKTAIVATGAYERPWPVPGWTLPGVMTTGAAQTLWRTARRLPGRRVLIAGNGPLNLQLAAELLEGGAEVLAVVEASPHPAGARWRAVLAMAGASPGLVLDGARYHAARRAGGAEMIYGEVVAKIEAENGALAVELGASGGTSPGRRFNVDALCLGYGFEPSNELLRALGCDHEYDRVRRQLVTRRDPEGRTSIPGVFAIGDCTGLGGARAALAEGTLAGSAAARDLGLRDGKLEPESRRATRTLARHVRFQRALWSLYSAPPFDIARATPDTLICRCEEVSFGQIEEALGEGLSGTGAVKRRTRVGMGRCQGRYCGPILDALLAARGGRERDAFSGFAPRVPVKPVEIADLARLAP